MNLTRRQFLKSLGNSYLLYAFSFVPGLGQTRVYRESWDVDFKEIECRALDLNFDYKESIVFDSNGHVTLFCGRTELGQGLKTVLTAFVTQGLDISSDQLTIILGNTDLCPDHGPTVGSAATELIAWGIWKACLEIRSDLVRQASQTHKIPVENLLYRKGSVSLKDTPNRIIKPHEIGGGKVVYVQIDPKYSSLEIIAYQDLYLHNVNAVEIVTGKRRYAGDLKVPELRYADWYIPPYHPRQSRLKSYDFTDALATPGVESVDVVRGKIVVVAERYFDVVKALSKIKAQWSKPTRPQQLRIEEEIRERAQLVDIKEQAGDVESGLAASYKTVTETYTTQYITWAQIETDTALAKTDKWGNDVTIWTGSQYPHLARKYASDYLKLPESAIHFIHTPVGGCFGGKVANPVSREAADLSRRLGVPIKMIYSRKNQFQKRGLYKMACVIDLTTGVGSDGRILARKIDIYQDLGEGTKETYISPYTLIRHFKAEWPFDLGNTRGTSYVQIGFAMESHMDMIAAAVGFNPFDFRRINVALNSFTYLIDACAEMIGYPVNNIGQDEGIGIGICNHGGRQMGAVAAHVAVDRSTGKITVKRLCGAFDLGTIVNLRTVTVQIRGGMMWGLGFALQEEVRLDGHSCFTEYLREYGVPRFSNVPDIKIQFLDNQAPGAPRGCGELPGIPTASAVANAVFNAIGIRFYSTPITPERVLKALGKA